MRLAVLLSFIVEQLYTAQGALPSVLFLRGAGPAEELTEKNEMKDSLGTASSGRRLLSPL